MNPAIAIARVRVYEGSYIGSMRVTVSCRGRLKIRVMMWTIGVGSALAEP